MHANGHFITEEPPPNENNNAFMYVLVYRHLKLKGLLKELSGSVKVTFPRMLGYLLRLVLFFSVN